MVPSSIDLVCIVYDGNDVSKVIWKMSDCFGLYAWVLIWKKTGLKGSYGIGWDKGSYMGVIYDTLPLKGTIGGLKNNSHPVQKQTDLEL